MVQSKQTKKSHSANASKQKSKRTTIDKIKKIAYQYGIPLAAVASVATALYCAFSPNAEQEYGKGEGVKEREKKRKTRGTRPKQSQISAEMIRKASSTNRAGAQEALKEVMACIRQRDDKQTKRHKAARTPSARTPSPREAASEAAS